MPLVSKPGDADALENQKKEKWEPPPKGAYKVEVIKAEEYESRSGNPCRKMEYRIVQGPQEGKTFGDYIAITDKTLWKLHTLHKALGLDTEVDWLEGKTWSKKVANENIWVEVDFEPHTYTIMQGERKGQQGTGFRAKVQFLAGPPKDIADVVETTEDDEDNDLPF